jgi:hypothetical protein
LNPGWPDRTATQLRQLQFHCGKPPPAADPRTLMSMETDLVGARRHGEAMLRMDAAKNNGGRDLDRRCRKLTEFCELIDSR